MYYMYIAIIHIHTYLRKIIPILEIVAGEAHDRSCDSNRKFTLGPNWILSPDGIVRSLKQAQGRRKNNKHFIVQNVSHIYEQSYIKFMKAQWDQQ